MPNRTFIDQTGYAFKLNRPPKRIISLVPSQTELLFHLGLENEIIGATKFCIHPSHAVKKITKIGGTKNFNFDKIQALNPDLIIANKEENYQEGIYRLRSKYPVWTSDIYSANDSMEMIKSIGQLTNRQSIAEKLTMEIKTKFRKSLNIHSGSVLYFIWQKPYMLAGKNTFIDFIINHIGFKNLASKLDRYPELNDSELKKFSPDYIFLSSEPYPFQQKHIDHYQNIFPKSKIRIVDGEMFSWYGNRLLLAFDYFKNDLLN